MTLMEFEGLTGTAIVLRRTQFVSAWKGLDQSHQRTGIGLFGQPGVRGNGS